jgi:hypothetical protein
MGHPLLVAIRNWFISGEQLAAASRAAQEYVLRK